MEAHRPRSETGDQRGRPGRRSRRDAAPLDADWLESEAIRHLARWESTRRGVREILERRLEARCERTGERPDAARCEIPSVIERLIDRGYVDDRRFAEQLVDRARRQGRSHRQIQAKLAAKGVEADVVDAVLREREQRRRADPIQNESQQLAAPHARAEIDLGLDIDLDLDLDEELEAAWKTARKRRLGPFCSDPSKRSEHRQRHLAALARQGFSREIAHRVIDADPPRGLER